MSALQLENKKNGRISPADIAVTGAALEDKKDL